VSPSGKAADFDSAMRWFESSHPCQVLRQKDPERGQNGAMVQRPSTSPCHGEDHGFESRWRRQFQEREPTTRLARKKSREERRRKSERRWKGCRQAVRQRILIPPCVGSNPAAPAKFFRGKRSPERDENGAMVQRPSTSPCHGEDHGFESRWRRQFQEREPTTRLAQKGAKKRIGRGVAKRPKAPGSDPGTVGSNPTAPANSKER
jgi:hypothetical protein